MPNGEGLAPLTSEQADEQYRRECAAAKRDWRAQAVELEGRALALESATPGSRRPWSAAVLGLTGVVLVPLAIVSFAAIRRPTDGYGWACVFASIVLLTAVGMWASLFRPAEGDRDLPATVAISVVVVSVLLLVGGPATPWQKLASDVLLVASLGAGLLLLPPFMFSAASGIAARRLRSRAYVLRSEAARLELVEEGLSPSLDR